MATTTEITQGALEQALTDADVRQLALIQLALTAGIVIFTAVVVFLAVTTEHAAGDPGLVGILSLVNALLCVSCFAGGMLLFPLVVSPSRLRSLPAGANAAAAPGVRASGAHAPLAAAEATQAVNLLKGGWIVRLAMLEGSALFGTVTCLLAVLGGLLPGELAYALNGLPALAFVLFSVATMPNRSRLMDVLLHRFLGTPG